MKAFLRSRRKDEQAVAGSFRGADVEQVQMEPRQTLAERHKLTGAGRSGGGVGKERGQLTGCHPWAA